MKKLLYAIAMVSCLYLHSAEIEDQKEADGVIDLTQQHITMARTKRKGGPDFKHKVRTIQSGKFYECSSCGKKFTRRNNAEKHFIRSHSSPQQSIAKKIKCFCDKTFSSNEALTKHMKKCHPEQSKEPISLPDPLDAEFNEITIKYPVIYTPAPPPADLDTNI